MFGVLCVENRYYHDKYFQKIITLYKENQFEKAIYEFNKYIKTYPSDLCAYVYYADAYIKLGNFEKAEEILKNAVISKGTSLESKEELTMIKVKLLCCQEKYQECLELLCANIDVFKKHNWGYEYIVIYLKKKLNKLDSSDYNNFLEKYLCSQIISYNEEKAIEHIKKHIINSDNFDNSKVLFVDDFPIEEIYFKLRKMLPLECKIYNDIICNVYFFKYESNGHVNSKLVDYFAVVTIKDTNNIITMYPYENREKRECINLTPPIEDIPKVKKISQIDKFNQRYGKKVD